MSQPKAKDILRPATSADWFCATQAGKGGLEQKIVNRTRPSTHVSVSKDKKTLTRVKVDVSIDELVLCFVELSGLL